MNGLVSGYGSDSDDEDANNTEESKSTDWMECMDNTTGYPYYWNRVSNEVRWDRPSQLPPLSKEPTKMTKNKPVLPSGKTKSKSPPQVFIGPTLPQLTPEEIARQKVIKFEESMAKDIEKEIVKEDPLDWHGKKPVKNLYSKPFAWKKSSTCLQIFRQMETSLKKASQSISLIAGSYGDEDETSDEDSPTKKKGVNLKVQKPQVAKPLLKEIPGIFKNEDEDDPPKKKRRWDMKDRTYISGSAEKLCQKLEALEVAKIPISPLKLLAIQVETLFAAWQNGALSNSYLHSRLEKMSAQMSDIESHHLAPPGWRAVWDRSAKKYGYENLITREMQFEKPTEEDEDEEDEIEEIPVKNSPPPLPPAPPEEESKPPLPPPEVPSFADSPKTPPLPAEAQVEDMELSEEESESAPIETSDKPDLSDALSSFYSDLATIDPESANLSQDSTPIPTPPKIESPGPSFIREHSPALSDDRSNSPLSYGETPEERRKRKTKISSGLGMKRKNVGSLVAKWQNIQDEVKRTK